MERTEMCDPIYPVLGVPVQLECADGAVLGLAAASFDPWCALPEHLIRREPAARVAISVDAGAGVTAGQDEMSYRVSRETLAGQGIWGTLRADRTAGMASACVTPSAVARSAFFRRNILECLVMFLATARDRVPLHAAGLIVNGTGLLICGESGSGKTTLSYELFRRGAYLLAEEAVYMASCGGSRLWGDPRGFSFQPGAASLFPELAGIPARRLPTGKTKMYLDLVERGASDRRHMTFSGPLILVILERVPGPVSRLALLPRQEIIRRLTDRREPGFDLSGDFEDTVGKLPLTGVYLLASGDDLPHKADLLESVCSGDSL